MLLSAPLTEIFTFKEPSSACFLHSVEMMSLGFGLDMGHLREFDLPLEKSMNKS